MSTKNKLILLALEFLFLPVFYLLLPPLIIRKFPGPSNLSSQNVLPLMSGKIYQASLSYPSGYFPCNFRSVSVVLKNPNLQNDSAIHLRLSDNQGQSLYEFSTSGKSIGDPHTLNPVFPNPLPCSSVYRLLLTTNNISPNSLYVYAESADNLNYQTQISYPSFQIAFQQNLQYQLTKLFALNYGQVLPWLFLILLCNLLLIK